MEYFEFVCTRNEGRSPVAEFIAQWYLNKIGVSDKFGARSSGSHRSSPDPREVQSTSGGDIPYESMEALVKRGIGQKIFSAKDLHSIDQIIKQRNSNKLKAYYGWTNEIFQAQERHFRADAVHRLVHEKGLKGYIKTHSDQTVPREDMVAVFCMAPNNTAKVREIYEGSGLSPLIVTLSAYATGRDDAELPNAFARGQQFYQKVIDQLLEQVPKAIDRFLRENP